MATVVKSQTVAFGLSLTQEETDFIKALTQNALMTETTEQTAIRQGIYTAIVAAEASAGS